MNAPLQLLVSVRNGQEAEAAIAGGCAIVDVKEPQRGSLGAAAPQVWHEVAECLAQLPVSPGLSLALGDVPDWDLTATLPAIPAATQYLKIGLAGLARSADWCVRLMAVREAFEQAAGAPHVPMAGWIAVSYVDYQDAEAPSPEAVLDVAFETQCRGVLLDTWSKAAGNLWDRLSPTQLADIVERVHARGLRLAAAGRLRPVDFAKLAACGVDIVGVRSAACSGFERRAAVSTDAVRGLTRAIAEVRGSDCSHPPVVQKEANAG